MCPSSLATQSKTWGILLMVVNHNTITYSRFSYVDFFCLHSLEGDRTQTSQWLLSICTRCVYTVAVVDAHMIKCDIWGMPHGARGWDLRSDMLFYVSFIEYMDAWMCIEVKTSGSLYLWTCLCCCFKNTAIHKLAFHLYVRANVYLDTTYSVFLSTSIEWYVLIVNCEVFLEISIFVVYVHFPSRMPDLTGLVHLSHPSIQGEHEISNKHSFNHYLT